MLEGFYSICVYSDLNFSRRENRSQKIFAVFILFLKRICNQGSRLHYRVAYKAVPDISYVTRELLKEIYQSCFGQSYSKFICNSLSIN